MKHLIPLLSLSLLLTGCLDKNKIRPEDPRVTYYNQKATKAQGKSLTQAQEFLNQSIILDPKFPFSRFNWATNTMISSVEQPPKNSPPGTKSIIYKSILKKAIKEFKSLQIEVPPEAGNFHKPLSYQLGQAETINSDINKALTHYYDSLVQGEPNDKLDPMTETNIRILLLAKSQQGDGSGEGEGKGEGGEGSDGGDIQKDAKEGADHTDIKQKAKFNQTDLNEEQAKQILESVSSEEKNVQEKRARKRSEEGKKFKLRRSKQW